MLCGCDWRLEHAELRWLRAILSPSALPARSAGPAPAAETSSTNYCPALNAPSGCGVYRDEEGAAQLDCWIHDQLRPAFGVDEPPTAFRP